MTRIAIIGNAGGGKSTISRKLREILDLPLHSIDQLQWLPGWKQAPKDSVASTHAQLIEQPRWIIDGWGNFDLIEARFRQADTIVLIDYPLWRHYWWAIKRQIACLFRPRIDFPKDCPMLPMTWPLLKMIWATNKDALPRLRSLISQQDLEKKVFHVRTLSDLRAFYREANASAA